MASTGDGGLSGLDEDELQRRLEEIKTEIRPLEQQLAELRARRDLVLTERRRRDRLDRRESRARLKSAMAGGELPTIAELVAGSDQGAFADYSYTLKTGGEVALGFPGARTATIAFTDGVKTVQARDLTQAAQLYAEGWEMGSPGRPGIRIHFPGTRQERLVDPSDVFTKPVADQA